MKPKIIRRLKARTPPFFVKLRSIAIGIGAVSTAVLTVPVSLPAIVTTIAGYVLTAATVAGAVSQLTQEQETPAGKR